MVLNRAKGERKKILLVDDDEIVLEVGAKLLNALGYDILGAESGEEAIERFEGNRETIALVILDLIMPGMGGEETYARLKQIDPNVKVILSSGFNMNGRTKQMMSSGRLDFIQKPFGVRDLTEAIRRVLDGQ